MPWFDMPLEQLREYRTATQEPDGLGDWWSARLRDARALAKPATLTQREPELYGPVSVDDVSFSGGNGDRIRGWYLTPRGAADAPVVVKFIGYGGGRGTPSEHMLLPALGYRVLVMDTRGQGGRWATGATPDGSTGTGPEHSQVMTRGILRPEDYYYTRLFTDAVLAVDAAREISGQSTVAVTGGSQGGALALAAAALNPSAVSVCHAEMPFMCDLQRAVTFAPQAPYTEIAAFLAENTDLIDASLETLRYVDCALLASRITATTLMSVGLMDGVCPPSTVFAAYNAINAAKDIVVYPFSGHNFPTTHAETAIAHLRKQLPA
jgi:cephalosporin-C deacetylase